MLPLGDVYDQIAHNDERVHYEVLKCELNFVALLDIKVEQEQRGKKRRDLEDAQANKPCLGAELILYLIEQWSEYILVALLILGDHNPLNLILSDYEIPSC